MGELGRWTLDEWPLGVHFEGVGRVFVDLFPSVALVVAGVVG